MLVRVISYLNQNNFKYVPTYFGILVLKIT